MFGDYNGWKAELAKWVDVADNSDIDTFLAFGERFLDKRLKIRDMLRQADSVITSDLSLTLPPDYNIMKSARIMEETGLARTPLRPKTLDHVLGEQDSTSTGTEIYSIAGTAIRVAPGGVGNTLRIFYYRKSAKLADTDGDTLYAKYAPEALLYASIVYALKFYQEEERLQSWIDQRDDEINGLNTLSKNQELGDAPLTIVAGRVGSLV